MAGYHSVNLVVLVGRVGKTYPKEHIPARGRTFMRIQMVTEDVYRTGQKRTDWHVVYLWGADANFAEKYLTVGSLVSVQGALRTNYKTDTGTPEGNKTRKIIVVEAHRFSVLVYNKAKEKKPEPTPEEEAKEETEAAE